MAERINFGKLTEIQEPPDLIELQTFSYKGFLQMNVPPTRREGIGLQQVFKEVFPIESYDGRHVLDFVKYELTEPKLDPVGCLREGETYAAPLRVTFRLKDGDHVTEEDVYMGEIPLMTEQGSFVVNGAERVVVCQLHRSPGICFEQSVHANGSILHSFRLIPDRGSWVEVQFDTSDMIWMYLDRNRRRRKFLVTTFLRALGCDTDDELLALFYTFETMKVGDRHGDEELADRYLREDVLDVDTQTVIARRYSPVTDAVLKQMKAAGLKTLPVVNASFDGGILLKNAREDASRSTEDALKDIYHKIRPGDPATVSNARQLLKRMFFDPRRFDLGRVGRYKINRSAVQLD